MPVEEIFAGITVQQCSCPLNVAAPRVLIAFIEVHRTPEAQRWSEIFDGIDELPIRRRAVEIRFLTVISVIVSTHDTGTLLTLRMPVSVISVRRDARIARALALWRVQSSQFRIADRAHHLRHLAKSSWRWNAEFGSSCCGVWVCGFLDLTSSLPLRKIVLTPQRIVTPSRPFYI